ncbi:MAG: DUF1638 domain-containing protein [Marinilabilia sp.]
MRKIIACGGIKGELEQIRKEAGEDAPEVQYLRQDFHRAPDKLHEELQKMLDQVTSEYDQVVLGYGLCSNAVAKLKAPKQGLYIPRVHDCIAFYLGSREKYQETFKKNPGTYYLTPTWINNQKDPLGAMRNEYTERVGPEMAEEAMRYEIKNYSRISFIETPHTNQRYWEKAKENADFFNKEFVVYRSNDTYFRKILFGPYNTSDFVYIEPHNHVKQQDFLK